MIERKTTPAVKVRSQSTQTYKDPKTKARKRKSILPQAMRFCRNRYCL